MSPTELLTPRENPDHCPATRASRRKTTFRNKNYVPDEDVVDLMNLADGFIYPSLYEGFGLPPLEAMACGKPTLVSNASSLPEVVADGALVVEPRDVEEMGEGIARLATDGALRAELSQRGRARAAQFTWARATAGLLAVIAELADQGG